VSRIVRREDGTVLAFEKPAWTSDETLLSREEVMLGAASAHEELFVNKGLQPGFLATLSQEIAALKTAKDGVTRARARLTVATMAFDGALEEGKAAIAVLTGILKTTADAPAVALTALKQAKRIHPRVTEEWSQALEVAVPPDDDTYYDHANRVARARRFDGVPGSARGGRRSDWHLAA
jgi:hypothetical protein